MYTINNCFPANFHFPLRSSANKKGCNIRIYGYVICFKQISQQSNLQGCYDNVTKACNWRHDCPGEHVKGKCNAVTNSDLHSSILAKQMRKSKITFNLSLLFPNRSFLLRFITEYSTLVYMTYKLK